MSKLKMGGRVSIEIEIIKKCPPPPPPPKLFVEHVTMGALSQD